MDTNKSIYNNRQLVDASIVDKDKLQLFKVYLIVGYAIVISTWLQNLWTVVHG